MSLYKNTVIIQDSITKDVVLVAFFTPFSELKKLLEDFQAMEKLSTEVIGVSKHASPVTNNKAH
jgi:peroxiredoxin